MTAPRTAPGSRFEAGRRSAPVWIGMAVVAALGWLYLGRMDAGIAGMGGAASAHAGMAMGGGDAGTLAMAFVMWAVMMMAMMLPTVAPSAAVFSALALRRDPARRDHDTTALYVAGYAASWIAYAAPAALVQWALTRGLLLDPMARSTSALLSAAILLAAGAYQWLPIKSACLSRCRSPLSFLMATWRDGARGAFVVGLRHGGYCVACCWALMAVMFVVGAMNLAWMGLVTLLILAEKLIPARWHFERALGVALVVSGAWIGAGAWPGA